VRSTGHCVVDGELEEGLRSVAVPVRDGSGAVVAAMNVSAPTSRGSVDALRAEVLPALLAAAAAVHQELATVC
jgi:IclR family pca regulon transcriptional regulator